VRIVGLPENPITELVLEAIQIEASLPGSIQYASGTWDPAIFPSSAESISR
jgi:hypothetical protein